MVRIDFPIVGMPGEHELIWAEHVMDRDFCVLVAPFFVDGIAVGDIVRCRDDSDVFDLVVTPSGHSTLRLAMGPDADQDDLERFRAFVQELCDTWALPGEWYSARLVALDIETPEDLVDICAQLPEQILCDVGVARGDA